MSIIMQKSKLNEYLIKHKFTQQEVDLVNTYVIEFDARGEFLPPLRKQMWFDKVVSSTDELSLKLMSTYNKTKIHKTDIGKAIYIYGFMLFAK